MAVMQSQAAVVPKSIKYKIMTLTLFPTSGCQFANPLSFSLYLRHGFCSESKFVKENSIVYENQTVKLYKSITKIQISEIHISTYYCFVLLEIWGAIMPTRIIAISYTNTAPAMNYPTCRSTSWIVQKAGAVFVYK